MDKGGYVILDIDNLTQPTTAKCYSGSPKITRALSRNGSNRMESWAFDRQEAEEETKKMVVKVAPSQAESLKRFLLTNKSAIAVQSSANTRALVNSREGQKRFSRLRVIHPSNVLLIFATMSCMGTMILIYFTLAAGQGGG